MGRDATRARTLIGLQEGARTTSNVPKRNTDFIYPRVLPVVV